MSRKARIATDLQLTIVITTFLILLFPKHVLSSCAPFVFSPKPQIQLEQRIKYNVIADMPAAPQYDNLRNYLLGDKGQCSQRWGSYGPTNWQAGLWEGLHTGVDYAASENTQIISAIHGEIITLKEGKDDCLQIKCLSYVGIYNNEVRKTFFYLHLKPDPSLKEKKKNGIPININDPIGLVGKRGPATGFHLHFEVRNGKRTFASLNVRDTVNPYCSVIHTRNGPITVPAWNFDTDSDLGCWQLFNLESYSVESGILSIDPAASDPYITSPPLKVNAQDYNTLEVRMASNAPDGNGAFYFATKVEAGYSEDKKISFAVTNDGKYYTRVSKSAFVR